MLYYKDEKIPKIKVIKSIGQEHFDLCFCEICSLPKVLCKHLRFSLEMKPKREMTVDTFKKELEALKETPKLRKRLESERAKKGSRIKELEEQINEIDKQINIIEEKQRKNNIEQIQEIEKKISQLKDDELKMTERKITEIQDKYKVEKDPLLEAIGSIDAKLKDKGGFLSPLFRVNEKNLRGKRLGLTKKIHVIDSKVSKEIKQAKHSISEEMAKEQLKLENQLRAILETPGIKELKGKRTMLERLMTEEVSSIQKIDEGIKKLWELASISISQSACSLRVEPISADLKNVKTVRTEFLLKKYLVLEMR